MSIGLALFIAAIFWLFYVLILKGWMWKILVGIFGFFGMYIFLYDQFPDLRNQGLQMGSSIVSWCAIVPAVILLLAMGYTTVNSEE